MSPPVGDSFDNSGIRNEQLGQRDTLPLSRLSCSEEGT